MATINKIYTRNGDLGQTYLANGQMIDKASPRIELLAFLDSLMLELGHAYYLISQVTEIAPQLTEQISLLLNRLFDQGAVLALTKKSKELLPTEAEISQLENWIDELNLTLTPLANFVLPQGNLVFTQIHRARTSCRILEQKLWYFNQTDQLDLTFLKFFNRLSDYLFVASRYVTKVLDLPETIWQTGKKIN